jgi:hypothetical protein
MNLVFTCKRACFILFYLDFLKSELFILGLERVMKDAYKTDNFGSAYHDLELPRSLKYSVVLKYRNFL